MHGVAIGEAHHALGIGKARLRARAAVGRARIDEQLADRIVNVGKVLSDARRPLVGRPRLKDRLVRDQHGAREVAAVRGREHAVEAAVPVKDGRAHDALGRRRVGEEGVLLPGLGALLARARDQTRVGRGRGVR